MSAVVPWLPNLRSLPGRFGIGGTGISAVVGLNPYMTKFDLWLNLKGKSPEQEQNDAMKWGLRLEPLIAGAYADETGNVIVKPAGVYQHEKFDFMTGSPDYFLRDKPEGIDAKSSKFKNSSWGEPGSDQVPEMYVLQAQWYMTLFKAQAWEIPALFGGSLLEIFRVEHNDRLEASLLEAAEEFWTRYIIGTEEPAIEDSPQVREWVKSRFPRSIKPMRKATADETALAVELNAAKEALSNAKDAAGVLETKIKAAIGPDEGLELPNGKVTFRSNKDSSETDWEAIATTLADCAYWRGNPDVYSAVFSKHTKTKPGARVLRVSIKDQP